MADSGPTTTAQDDDEPAPGELDGAGRRRNGRESHGLHRAKRLLREAYVRGRVMYAANTYVGKQNVAQREALTKYCGGESALTPTIRVAIDEIVRIKMLQTFTDSFLAELGPRIVNRRRKTLAPVVEQRLRLSDALQKHVAQLEASLAARTSSGESEMSKAWREAVQSANAATENEAYAEHMRQLRDRGQKRAALDFKYETAVDAETGAPRSDVTPPE